MKTKRFTVLAIAMFMVSVMAIGTAEAFKCVSADTALKMYQGTEGTYEFYAEDPGDGTGGSFYWPDGKKAIIVDIRTLEEYYFVGTCAETPNGDPIAYNIPWKLWTSRIDCEEGKPLYRTDTSFAFL